MKTHFQIPGEWERRNLTPEEYAGLSQEIFDSMREDAELRPFLERPFTQEEIQEMMSYCKCPCGPQGRSGQHLRDCRLMDGVFAVARKKKRESQEEGL